MATSLWVKAIRRSQIVQQVTEPCPRTDPMDALTEACHQLDLARPMWLDKNQREWEQFGQTRFMPDAFPETVHFDRLEIEFIDPEASKKKSRDPRNQ